MEVDSRTVDVVEAVHWEAVVSVWCAMVQILGFCAL